MNRNRTMRIAAAFLCAAMLLPIGGTAFAGTSSAVAVRQMGSTRPTDQEILYGAHMGNTSTSINWSIGSGYPVEANVDYVTGNLYVNLNSAAAYYEISYNSQDPDTTIIGNGFTCNYTQSLKQYAKGSDDVLVYVNEFGKKEYLNKTVQDDGTIQWGNFVRQPNGDRNGGYYQSFDEQGRLQQIRIPHLAYLELMRFDYNPMGLLIHTYGQIEERGAGNESFLYYTLIGDRQLPLVTQMVNLGWDNMYFDYDERGNMTSYKLDERTWFDFLYEEDSSRIRYLFDMASNESITYTYTLHDGYYKVSFMQKTDVKGNILDQTQFAYGNGQ
ncbi:MAG: hypothetical protein ACLSAP_04905, partial [Oscillospiraceae bacterium]